MIDSTSSQAAFVGSVRRVPKQQQSGTEGFSMPRSGPLGKAAPHHHRDRFNKSWRQAEQTPPDRDRHLVNGY
jgi:hypothetical protein